MDQKGYEKQMKSKKTIYIVPLAHTRFLLWNKQQCYFSSQSFGKVKIWLLNNFSSNEISVNKYNLNFTGLQKQNALMIKLTSTCVCSQCRSYKQSSSYQAKYQQHNLQIQLLHYIREFNKEQSSENYNITFLQEYNPAMGTSTLQQPELETWFKEFWLLLEPSVWNSLPPGTATTCGQFILIAVNWLI